MHISGMLSGFAPSENSPDLSIILLCIVGVDGCTEESTGISSDGLQSTIATPSDIHATGTTEESSAAGRNYVIMFRYRITLEIRSKHLSASSTNINHQDSENDELFFFLSSWQVL